MQPANARQHFRVRLLALILCSCLCDTLYDKYYGREHVWLQDFLKKHLVGDFEKSAGGSNEAVD